MENLSVIVKQANLDEIKSKSILDSFSGFFEIASEWESKAKQIQVTDESQKDLMRTAREGRLFLKQKRVDVENKRKALKEQSLREGQTIDSIARILKNLIEPIEDHLDKQEKFAEIKEAQRKEALQAERIEILKPLNAPYSLYDLKNMAESDFNDLVNGLKAAIQARIESERKAEAERIEREKAEAAERERIRIENEKLKAEAAERERQMTIERAKVEAERKAAEELARKEREEMERKLKIEAAEREKAEAELRARKENEERAEKEAAEIKRQRIEVERKAKRAPDKEKLLSFADAVISMPLPEVKSEDAEKILADVKELIYKIHDYIISKIKNL